MEPCTLETHEAIKLDEAAWTALRFNHFWDTGDGYVYEARDCRCRSTLLRAARRCVECGAPMQRKPGFSLSMWAAQKYCGQPCYHRARAIEGLHVLLLRVIGERYGHLTVTAVHGGPGERQRRVSVVCDCGRQKRVLLGHIEAGNTISCGKCLSRPRIHGLTNSPEMRAWQHARHRCTNPAIHNYHRYGGRGISMCARWLESFSNFLEDMGRRPSPGHSLDRIDLDGNYEPGNCRWATVAEQAANKSNNVRLTFSGETLHIAEWSRRTGINAATLAHRARSGWSPERVLGIAVPL